MKDEFGRYIWEEYIAEDGREYDDDGNRLMRRKVNPSYNENQEYVPRKERPEWDVVGLMGKLRVRVGQQVDSNWIKMRDISDSVEEYLVR